MYFYFLPLNLNVNSCLWLTNSLDTPQAAAEFKINSLYTTYCLNHDSQGFSEKLIVVELIKPHKSTQDKCCKNVKYIPITQNWVIKKINIKESKSKDPEYFFFLQKQNEKLP